MFGLFEIVIFLAILIVGYASGSGKKGALEMGVDFTARGTVPQMVRITQLFACVSKIASSILSEDTYGTTVKDAINQGLQRVA